MSLLRIRVYGDPVLRQKAQPVERVDESLKELAADMAETMYASNGIGLAATQVGDLRRVFVVDIGQVENSGSGTPEGRRQKNASKRNLMVFINPHVLDPTPADCPFTEGCLSIPGLEGEVFRPEGVRVRYLDTEGAEKEFFATGLLARVIQHEFDHLEGVLFVDRMPPGARRSLAGELAYLREVAVAHPEGITAEQSRTKKF